VRGGGARTPLVGLDASYRAFVDPVRKDPFVGLRCAVPLEEG
jgi:formylglycine-generating enzyme required for sulfatase activity